MSYEKNYNTTNYYHSHYIKQENSNNHNNESNNHNNESNNHNNESNNHNNENNNDNDDSSNNIEMNNVDRWHLQTLYTDTKYVYAAKREEVLTCDQLFARQNRIQTHPSSLPVIVKDVTQPHKYYTMKSYGEAQDNNYYVNFDDHVNVNANPNMVKPEYNYNNNTHLGSKTSTDDSRCEKTYLCGLFGCFACCLFKICF